MMKLFSIYILRALGFCILHVCIWVKNEIREYIWVNLFDTRQCAANVSGDCYRAGLNEKSFALF